MVVDYTVELSRIIKEYSLEELFVPEEEVLIKNNDINRPGLQLGGYYEYFDNTRIQIIGKAEESYIKELAEDEYTNRVDRFFASKPVAVIISRGLDLPSFANYAKKYNVPLLRTSDSTSIAQLVPCSLPASDNPNGFHLPQPSAIYCHRQDSV